MAPGASPLCTARCTTAYRSRQALITKISLAPAACAEVVRLR